MAGRDASPNSTSSTLSCITVQTEHQSASHSFISASPPPTSTPPTSLGDEASVLSDATKMDQLVETQGEISTAQVQTEAQATPQPAPAVPNSEGRRSARSSRKSVVTYNVQILAGTAIHTPSKYLEKHHKNVLHGPIEKVIKTNTATSPKKRAVKPDPDDIHDPAEEQLATEAAQAAQRRTSSRVTDLRKEAFRNLTGNLGDAVAQTLSHGRDVMQNALRKSASDSRLKNSNRLASPASPKRPRAVRVAEPEDESQEPEEEKVFFKPKSKEWLKAGLYVGQHRDFDARLSESQNRSRKRTTKARENRFLPLPMFAGERMLSGDPRHEYRNFKLPFDTYHPLPRKVKVDGWVKLNKNRFIGDASALWKRDKQDSSSCYCSAEDGCGEDCHNRIMAYECDSTNCKLKPEQCGNRPFLQLKRRAKGNGYDYGVEVMDTQDRGYGVRAMRTFEPHQIIVEYAGEIITQQECERRMKQVYKKDKCYYLMSFDNKMIIDATRGTIARFVNHSCEPNCEMIKWTVSGEPRMALFAGSRGIMTGEELTYDYNFDPFSSKNIQECRCGTKSCRGVLGPKPKKPILGEKSTSGFFAGTKRKLQEVFGSGKGSNSAPNSPKKRKLSYMAHSATTKAQNAIAESAAAREKAEKNAAEMAAQKASRENRAMKRSSSMTLSSKRSKILRKASRTSMPNLTSTRHTTVSIKRKTLPKAGTLKPVTKASRLSAIIKRNNAVPKAKKRQLSSPAKTSKSPASKSPASSPPPFLHSSSPNITPASLRSASKKFKQTKLPFKPLSFDTASSSSSDSMGFPETDDDDDYEEDEKQLGKKYAAAKASSKKRVRRGRPSAASSFRKTGGGVKKTADRNVNSNSTSWPPVAVDNERRPAYEGLEWMQDLWNAHPPNPRP